jgi:hypothetical protein
MPVTLTLRRVKLSPLTNDELDDNLVNLRSAIETLESTDVSLAGSGAAGTAARSDHNHSGVYADASHTHPTADVFADGTVTDQVLTWNGSAWVAQALPAAPVMSASAILAALVTIDGVGSGLDADLLDGQNSTYYATAASVTASSVLSSLLTVDGVGSGLDADLLDGQNSTYYATAASVSGKANADVGNLGVGTIALCQYIGGGSVSPGNTTAGSNLLVAWLQINGTPGTPVAVSGSVVTGTWRNISGITSIPTDVMTPQYYLMVWQRIA